MQVMEFVSAFSHSRDQTCRFENDQMLRDGLACEPCFVFHR